MSDGYEQFINQMKKLTGIDLSLYKEEQMKRRLVSLKDKHKADSFDEYFKMMIREPELLEECLDRMTINVSGFFRNRQRWDILEQTVLPDLLKTRKNRLKIWSAACSTGEEPYTLSMVLSRHLPITSFDILATDIDEKVLEKANLGIYDERSLNECPESDREQYFDKDEKVYRVKPRFKAPIHFKKHNLLEGPYEKSYDLIVCRNVLIYFTESAKQSIYRKFSESLNPGGILFIGSTEQIFNPLSFGLQPVTTFFYQKVDQIPDRQTEKSGQLVGKTL